MPRAPRIFGDDVHYHIILRCNNKERLLRERKDFEIMLAMLHDVRDKFYFRLYNYELLHAHVHLMLSTHDGYFLDEIMHELCLKYTKDFNQRHRRSGHLWAHRYRHRIILNDQHGLACLRYQHRNALSLGLVLKPEDWPWSGYHFYALGVPNDLLEPHPSYLILYADETKRKQVYQELVNTPIPSDKIPSLLEKGGGRVTKRFRMMVEQTERLRTRISI